MSKKHKQQHKRQQRRQQQKLQPQHKQQKRQVQQQQQQLSAANISAVVAAQQCTGCSACVALCSDHALSMQPNSEGFLEPVIDEAKCTHCGQCSQHCPVLKRQFAPAKLAQAVRAKGLNAQGTQQRHTEHAGFTQRYLALNLKPDFKALYGSSTTGVGFVLAHRFVRAGGVVVGCRFNAQTQEAEHVIARTVEEVVQFCGSKYVQSNKHEVMAQTLELLKQGQKVLFIGTPCEVAGVKALCSTQPAEVKARLFTVDLVCHGVPSPLSFKCYLHDAAAELGAIRALNFRVPHPQTKNWTQPVVVVQGEAKRLVQPAAQNHFYVAYSQSWSLRPSCYHCPYTNLNRPSDLSLGDFWGISNVVPECWHPELGVTQALVNTLRGEKLLQLLHYSIRDAYAVTEQQVKAVGPMLLKSAVRPAGRDVYYRVLNATHDPAQALQAARGAYQTSGS